MADYLESIRRAGGEPVELDYQRDEPGDVIRRSHGLLLTGGIALEQGRLRRARHEAGAEHRPPQLVVGGLVHEHVILRGEEPGQRARRELVAAVAQQVGRPAAHDEVELQLGMAMASRRPVGGEVVTDAPGGAGAEAQILGHRKKR